MKFQRSPKGINRLLAIQDIVANHYGKLAAITTEKDLVRIFTALQKHHLSVKEELEVELFPQPNSLKNSLRKGKTLIGKLWYEVMIAVLVNNREKLVEYCRQNEVKLLQEIQIVLNSKEISPRAINILADYEQGIYNYLEKLSHVPNKIIHYKKAA